jgi:hypothetical protein
VQFAAVFFQPVSVAHVDRDRAMAAQVPDVLVDERERGVRRPLRQDIGALLAGFRRQVEEQRGLVRIG